MGNQASGGGNQAPGSERSKTTGTQGSDSPGSRERNRSGQMEQSGRQGQGQQGGSQRPDRSHDSDPGHMQDKEKDRSK